MHDTSHKKQVGDQGRADWRQARLSGKEESAKRTKEGNAKGEPSEKKESKRLSRNSEKDPIRWFIPHKGCAGYFVVTNTGRITISNQRRRVSAALLSQKGSPLRATCTDESIFASSRDVQSPPRQDNARDKFGQCFLVEMRQSCY